MAKFELGEAQKTDLVKYALWIQNHATEIEPEPTTRNARSKNKRMKGLILSRSQLMLKILDRAKLVLK